ncbi:MAG TPA: hypothetical protein VFW31_11570 [Candidatus Angelobacter sp.]|nr:hypothetical protein [Candidatus Angelobacter sp.]
MANFERWLLGAFLLVGGTYVLGTAQGAPSHSTQHEAHATQQDRRADTLLDVVRKATERYKDVNVARAEGFGLVFGCVQGPDSGAMGMHFLNPQRLTTDLDPSLPQILIYEPQPDGKLKLIGADFLVDAAAWDKLHPKDPPQLLGQLFHFFESPNRFGLDPFYTLHVWAWKENPNGAFVNWHPNVSCQSFTGDSL